MRDGNFTKYSKYFLLFFVSVFMSKPALANVDNAELVETEHYRVQGNKIDPQTFAGWNVFHRSCVNCHGIGAVGTDIAPDLTESVERMSLGSFRIKVLHKTAIKFTGDDWREMEQSMFEEIIKQQQRDKGELATMPRWEYNPIVKEQVQNIYRYLRARGDGAIGTDKPEILK